MSTDLVTYYGQTDRIDQLVDKYGSHLEQLDRETKLLLRITLATYVLMQQEYSASEYPMSSALEDSQAIRKSQVAIRNSQLKDALS